MFGVVLTVECPSLLLTAVTGTPLERRADAWPWRSEWKLNPTFADFANVPGVRKRQTVRMNGIAVRFADYQVKFCCVIWSELVAIAHLFLPVLRKDA